MSESKPAPLESGLEPGRTVDEEGGVTHVESKQLGEKDAYGYCPLCGADTNLDVTIRR